jgi:hypothetical protein
MSNQNHNITEAMTSPHTHTISDILTGPKGAIIPVGVSGMTYMGFTLQDLVYIGTLILLVIQIGVWAFKGAKCLKRLFKQ